MIAVRSTDSSWGIKKKKTSRDDEDSNNNNNLGKQSEAKEEELLALLSRNRNRNSVTLSQFIPSAIRTGREFKKKHHEGKRRCQEEDPHSHLPVIFLITPTYARLNQKADLTRLSYTLLLVPRLHWILVEDSHEPTKLVTNFLSRLTQEVIPNFCSDLKITQLNIPTPEEYKLKARDPSWLKPRGVLQRNLGLSWLRNQSYLYRKHRIKKQEENEEQEEQEHVVRRETRAAAQSSSKSRTDYLIKSQVNNWNPDATGKGNQEEDVKTDKKKKNPSNEWRNHEGIRENGGKNDGRKKRADNFVLSDDSSYYDESSVVYFADDDNTYDIRLFEEMRFTLKVSVWPVALVGTLKIERPILSEQEDNQVQDEDEGKHKQHNIKRQRVIGFNSVWKPDRPYPIDMASFAVSLKLILDKKDAEFSYQVPRGYQESHLLSQLIDSWNDLEPKAQGCTQVLVWHTRTEKPKVPGEKKLQSPSDQDIEF